MEIYRINTPKYNIVMSEEEVNFLYDLLQNVGGYSEHSRRHLSDEILQELKECGVRGYGPCDMVGTIECIQHPDYS